MTANLSGCIAVFSALNLLGILWFMKRMLNIRKLEHDLQIVTISDYTLEILLTRFQNS